MGKTMKKKSEQKLWGGRFNSSTEDIVEQLNASIEFDQRLFHEDISGSIAHAKMLASCNIISIKECDLIVNGLQEIYEEIKNGDFNFQIDREDIHLNIEAALIDRIGSVGAKLHTARSRNDQIATDIRLFTRKECTAILQELRNLRRVLLNIAEQESQIILPGYTHLQRAQPILLSHHLQAYEAMFSRDSQRFEQTRLNANKSPLGAGALAGVTYPIDRNFVAKELGFDSIITNSIDAVADRDFILDFHSAASTTMIHLSRLAEEIIIWGSSEFNFLTFDDAFATGSSIMPQKKNPDVAELIRGKSARVIGNLVQSLTLLKSQPLAYNKDLQEDKESFFDTVDTVKICLIAMHKMLPTLGFNAENMYKAANDDFILATDFADYLSKKGIPFRDAHEAIGKLVLYCEDNQLAFSDLSLEDLQKSHALFDSDILEIDIHTALSNRNVIGGTGPESVNNERNEAMSRLDLEENSHATTKN